jgi:hypothetical protein
LRPQRGVECSSGAIDSRVHRRHSSLIRLGSLAGELGDEPVDLGVVDTKAGEGIGAAAASRAAPHRFTSEQGVGERAGRLFRAERCGACRQRSPAPTHGRTVPIR